MKSSRVVVTGVGVVCAGGLSREEFWSSVTAGKSGIKPLESIDAGQLRTRVAGEIKHYRPEDYFTRRQLRRLDRAGQYAVIAAREAVIQAGLDFERLDPFRAGVILGTSLGGMQSGDRFHRQWLTRGLRRARPGLLLSYPIHAPCDAVAHHLGLKGPRSVVSTACAAGANALGLARDLIVSGRADVMLAGGVDPLCLLSFCGFSVLQAACPGPCAPYSRSDGLNLGEGAAVLVMEPLEKALERGAAILAEFLGYGLSADAYHPTAPDPGGQGAAAAMVRALRMAGVAPEEVSYINGHGTGTPANDLAEPKAMRLVFGERLPAIPISSTKSMIGHTLGAAGAVEAAACVLAVERGVVPPTINFQPEKCANTDLDFVPNRSRPHRVEVALSNSFAFGGNNACVIVGEYRPGRKLPPCGGGEDAVVITGLGAVGAAGQGVESWWRSFTAGRPCWGEVRSFDPSPYRCRHGAEMIPLSPRGYTSPETWRRMDALSRQALVAARQALDHAGLYPGREEAREAAVIFATGSGPLETVEAFNRSIILKGPAAANPRLFPNTVMNAAAGYICLAMGFRGPTSTIAAGGVSGSTALIYAAEMLRRGRAGMALVVCADEFNEALLAGHDCLPGLLTGEKVRPFDRRSSGTLLGAAGIAFVLEREDGARERRAKIYARLAGYGMAGDTCKPGGLDPRGGEWARAVGEALRDAGIGPEQAGYCAAAACGVGAVDRAEAAALVAAGCGSVPVGAPKSITGDCMGSSGAVNVLAAVLALTGGALTPTVNLEEPLPDLPLNHVRVPGVKSEVRYALVNSFAYGGNYVTLVLAGA
ncbi:MAG: beta-ketoacyl-[acyl-carrier-protein] synthase family protein [Armatimonadetes bacterium]|nr:beta-ketoacyl-[acyl-carrier-protein] synthase family protein [Armatimonadota bacterium]